MSSIMDAAPTKITSECASCRQMKPIVCCFCDTELCEDCTHTHLNLCYYAKARVFRTWNLSNLTRAI